MYTMCGMKQRVTLVLEEIPYKALRVMAATENKSMSLLVEEFVMGTRQNISDPEEIKRIEKLDAKQNLSTEFHPVPKTKK